MYGMLVTLRFESGTVVAGTWDTTDVAVSVKMPGADASDASKMRKLHRREESFPSLVVVFKICFSQKANLL